jgi:hypothetical protein
MWSGTESSPIWKSLQGHEIWARTNDDLVDIAAGKDAERALMQVHDGQVGPPPLHDVIVRVQTHQQEVPLCPRQLRTQTIQPMSPWQPLACRVFKSRPVNVSPGFAFALSRMS